MLFINNIPLFEVVLSYVVFRVQWEYELCAVPEYDNMQNWISHSLIISVAYCHGFSLLKKIQLVPMTVLHF